MKCYASVSFRGGAQPTDILLGWEDKKRWKSCPSQSSGATEKTLAPRTPCNYLSLTLIILSCALRQVKAPWVSDILQNANCNSTMALSYSLIWEMTNPPGFTLHFNWGLWSMQEEYNGREFHLLPSRSCVVCIVHNVSSPSCWHFWLSASFLGGFQCVCVFYFVQFCYVAEVAIIHNGLKFQLYASERFKHPFIVLAMYRNLI